jgi:hypothetical protein
MKIQREIKFRIWSKFQKRFLTNLELDSYNISLRDGHILFIDGHDVNTSFYKCQYTGLKDKNNIEIYEGDIVRAVVYDVDDNGKMIEKNIRLEIIEFIDGKYNLICNNYQEELEIVGNRYTNPQIPGDSK